MIKNKIFYSPLKIFLVVVYYLPSTKSSAKLIHDLALEFKDRGHDVTVITPSESIQADSEIDNIEGIKVLRVKTGKIDGASKIPRTINELLLSYKIWQKGKSYFKLNPCDLVVYYSPTIFFGALVKKIKQVYGSSSYLILRDIFPQWALDTGVLKKGLIFKFFQKKELDQYNAADIIGVQSPANLNYFHEKGWDKKFKLEVLYNWTKVEEPALPFFNYREKLGLQGKVVFFYGGNIGVAQDMDNLLRLAESLKCASRAHFLFVGSGSEVNRIKEEIKNNNLTNVTLLEAVGQKEYLSMLSEFDVGLISLDRKIKTPNFPGKMLGYMYFSMPILASINEGNDLKLILEDSNAGLVTINGNDKPLFDNALSLCQDKDLRIKIGANSKHLLQSTFSVVKTADQILSHFQ